MPGRPPHTAGARPARPARAGRAPWVLALAATLAGCGGSGHTVAPTPAPVGTLADVRAMIVRTIVPGTVMPTNADTTASLFATMDVDGLRGASAVFVAGASLASVGAVTVRTAAPDGAVSDVPLDRLSALYAGNPEYAYTTLVSHPLGVALAFDGAAYHRLDVTGASAWGTFADSVRSVGAPAIGVPAPGGSTSRASDLGVTWTDPGSDTTVYVICAVRSPSDTTHVAFGGLVLDASGAATIPAARLGTLPAGPAMLAVTRYRLVYHGTGGRRVGLACLATSTRSLALY